MKNQDVDWLSVLLHLWPLLFVPLTLFAVKSYGHVAGNLLLGALFLYLIVARSDLKTRRLMIVLAVFSTLFETANVASGAYTYHGTLGAPLWIGLGWAILGWWLVQLSPKLKSVPFWPAFGVASAALALASYLTGTLSVQVAFSVAGLYVLSLAIAQPFAIYAFTSLFAIVAEWSGTFAGVWTYYDAAQKAVAPDLAMLALVYPVVLAFSFWVSGFERD